MSEFALTYGGSSNEQNEWFEKTKKYRWYDYQHSYCDWPCCNDCKCDELFCAKQHGDANKINQMMETLRAATEQLKKAAEVKGFQCE